MCSLDARKKLSDFPYLRGAEQQCGLYALDGHPSPWTGARRVWLKGPRLRAPLNPGEHPPMAYYEDVLDHMGRAPREFGSLHIHVEPVVRGPSGEAVATVWLQNAFEPRMPGDSVHVISGPEGSEAEQSLGRFPVPPMGRGQAVRWSLPLTVPEGATELHFLVESRLHPQAQRVRTAWKLLDTIEIPKESDMQPTFSVEFDVRDSLTRSLLSGELSPSFDVRTSLVQDVRSTRHPARKLPPAFIAQVTEGARSRLNEPGVEVVWAPGRPLPAPPPLVPSGPVTSSPSRNTLRICYSCGFEGPKAEYAHAAFCPRCEAIWD